jgi:hypothetical protein
MHKPTQPQLHSGANYVLPEPQHIVLVQMRNHMQLLAQLVGDGTTSFEAPRLNSEDLAWCFTHLATDLNSVVSASYWLAPGRASEPASNKKPRTAARE